PPEGPCRRHRPARAAARRRHRCAAVDARRGAGRARGLPGRTAGAGGGGRPRRRAGDDRADRGHGAGLCRLRLGAAAVAQAGGVRAHRDRGAGGRPPGAGLGPWRRRRTAAGTAVGRRGGAIRCRCAGRRGDRAAGRSAIATVVDAVYPAGHAGSDLGAVPIDGGAVSAVPAAQETPGWRWAPAWVLAFVALWPAPGYAEGVLALGALAGLARPAASRFRGGIALL